MAYTPSIDKLSAINQKLAMSPDASNPAPSQPGKLESFAAGFANPLIDAANIVAKSDPLITLGNAALKYGIDPLIGKKYQLNLPTVPQMPYSPGISHTLGSIAGYAVPSTATMKGVELAADALKDAPLIGRVLGSMGTTEKATGAGQIAKGAISGAPAGALVNPQNRTFGAEVGALGGALGEGIGQSLVGMKNRMIEWGIPQAFQKKIMESVNPYQSESPADDLLNNIASHYIKARNIANLKYNGVFSDAKRYGLQMTPADLPNYADTIEEYTRNGYQLPPVVLKKTPAKMMRDLDNNGDPYINPEEVHYLRSQIGGLTKTVNDPEMREQYQDYFHALNDDLENFLKNGPKMPGYGGVFREDSGIQMGTNDLKNYRDLIKQNIKLKRSIPSAIMQKTPGKMMRDYDENDTPYIKPNEVGTLIDKISSLANTTKDPEMRGDYQNYRDALQSDVSNFLRKRVSGSIYNQPSGGIDLSGDYNNAKNFFKKVMVPFKENKIFNSKVKPFIDQSIQNRDGMDSLSKEVDFKKPINAQQVANSFMPGTTDKGLDKFEELSRLVGSKGIARQHARNVMLMQHSMQDPETGNTVLNIKSLLDREGKLSPQQRDFLLSPDEQRLIQAARITQSKKVPELSKQAGKLLGGGALVATGGALGKMLGHTMGSEGLGAAAGMLGAIPSSRFVTGTSEAIGNALTQGMDLPQLTNRILQSGERRAKPFLRGVPATALSSAFSQGIG